MSGLSDSDWQRLETRFTKLEEKIEKKASLQLVPKASVRNAQGPQEDADGPSDREFIAAEAKRRGQGFPR